MSYEVMEIRRPKRKNSAEKIKKYQFKTIIDKMIGYKVKISIPVAGQLASALSIAFSGGVEFTALSIFAETLVHYHTASAEATSWFNVL